MALFRKWSYPQPSYEGERKEIVMTNGRTRQSGVTCGRSGAVSSAEPPSRHLARSQRKHARGRRKTVLPPQVPTCYSSGCLSKYLSTVYPTATVIMTANYQLAERPANARVTAAAMAAAGFNLSFHQHTQTHKLRQKQAHKQDF